MPDELLSMEFNCNKCGYSRTPEEDEYGFKGRSLSLLVNTVEDLNREVLKSDTALLSIPEIDF